MEEEVLEEEGSVSGPLAVTGAMACIRQKSIFNILPQEQMYMYMYINKQQCHTYMYIHTG